MLALAEPVRQRQFGHAVGPGAGVRAAVVVLPGLGPGQAEVGAEVDDDAGRALAGGFAHARIRTQRLTRRPSPGFATLSPRAGRGKAERSEAG